MPLDIPSARASIVAAARRAIAEERRLDCADLALDVTARAARAQIRSFHVRIRRPPKGARPIEYSIPASATEAEFERELRRIRMNVGAVHLYDGDFLTTFVDLKDLEPGDLVLVRTARSPLYTGHTMIVVGVSGDTVETVEGHIQNQPPTLQQYTKQALEQMALVMAGARRWRWDLISPQPP